MNLWPRFDKISSRGAAEFAEKACVMGLRRDEGIHLNWGALHFSNALTPTDWLTPSAPPRGAWRLAHMSLFLNLGKMISRGAAEGAEKECAMGLHRGERSWLSRESLQTPNALTPADGLTPSASPRLRVSYGNIYR